MSTAIVTRADTDDVQRHVGQAEWAVRVELAAAYRLAARFGWTDHIFTHFSARVPGVHDHFLINPYGLTFDEVSASNLVRIDIEGKVLYDPLGRGHNLAGYVIHGAIHSARPDLTCILHTHTTPGVAVSAQETGLLTYLSQQAARFHGQIAYHDYEGFAFNREEQARLIRDIGDKRILILRNHGLLTAGASIGEAFHHLYFLERSCAIQIAAQAGGNPLRQPPDAIVAEAAAVYWRGVGGTYTDRTWQAFLRDLQRHDSTFQL
ncbi:class II aldolase/adducin family protein [Bordetella genomosp. 12]|uniref:Class II aldolase n=1 Tax=Bordetella genomosp. 12 TaxID=463035 RepID=A0A261VDD6_9BORD|nr:class II aldolase/adducin family protein [Bordetella genomosp. 12]OZI71781.1 class II aldolase [Bordetella genomosp. 12]